MNTSFSSTPQPFSHRRWSIVLLLLIIAGLSQSLIAGVPGWLLAVPFVLLAMLDCSSGLRPESVADGSSAGSSRSASAGTAETHSGQRPEVRKAGQRLAPLLFHAVVIAAVVAAPAVIEPAGGGFGRFVSTSVQGSGFGVQGCGSGCCGSDGGATGSVASKSGCGCGAAKGGTLASSATAGCGCGSKKSGTGSVAAKSGCGCGSGSKTSTTASARTPPSRSGSSSAANAIAKRNTPTAQALPPQAALKLPPRLPSLASIPQPIKPAAPKPGELPSAATATQTPPPVVRNGLVTLPAGQGTVLRPPASGSVSPSDKAASPNSTSRSELTPLPAAAPPAALTSLAKPEPAGEPRPAKP